MTLRNLSSQASLSEAQAIWRPLPELIETSEILYGVGQTFTVKVESLQSRFHHMANLDLYISCPILHLYEWYNITLLHYIHIEIPYALQLKDAEKKQRCGTFKWMYKFSESGKNMHETTKQGKYT